MSTVTVFVCNCCGHVAHAVTGKHSDHPALRHKLPITQIECHEITCRNYMRTIDYRADDAEAVEQTARYYTAVAMDESQVARFIEAIDSKGELS